MGILISQDMDPYEPISIMECQKGFWSLLTCLRPNINAEANLRVKNTLRPYGIGWLMGIPQWARWAENIYIYMCISYYVYIYMCVCVLITCFIMLQYIIS